MDAVVGGAEAKGGSWNLPHWSERTQEYGVYYNIVMHPVYIYCGREGTSVSE